MHYHCHRLTMSGGLMCGIAHLSALEHLHDLLHDLRVHALGLLQLLTITVDDGGGGLGDAEVLLEQ
jgi:hypothetical protein